MRIHVSLGTLSLLSVLLRPFYSDIAYGARYTKIRKPTFSLRGNSSYFYSCRSSNYIQDHAFDGA